MLRIGDGCDAIHSGEGFRHTYTRPRIDFKIAFVEQHPIMARDDDFEGFIASVVVEVTLALVGQRPKDGGEVIKGSLDRDGEGAGIPQEDTEAPVTSYGDCLEFHHRL